MILIGQNASVAPLMASGLEKGLFQFMLEFVSTYLFASLAKLQ